MGILEEISQSLQDGDEKACHLLTNQAIEQNLSAKDILDDGLIAGMNVVGEKFSRRDLFLPEVLLSARAMNAAMDFLKPHFLKEEVASKGKIVIGTVRGDLHDIGKNLVGIMLRGAGYEIIDLGNDVPAEKFVETAKKEGAAAIGISAMLTTTMPIMGQVVEQLREEGLGDSMKIVVGGAPVSQDYADQIGADGYGYDAANAVVQVKRLLMPH
jgi:5-methyltetrahydrofolate--homocysteine methyltransferase